MKAKIISMGSMKGGVGKSVLINSIASELQKKNKKVLIIDLDSNQVTTEIFGLKNNNYTSLGLLNGDKIEPIKCTDYISVIPSELRNCMMTNIAEKCLINGINKNGYKEMFDYILIDPPGTWGVLVRNSLRACDIAILPGNPSDMDLEPINLLVGQMENIDLPQEPDVWAVLNMWDVKKNQNGILSAYQELGEMFYQNPISSMKGFRNLTEDIYNYSLRGSARKQINDLMIEVGIV